MNRVMMISFWDRRLFSINISFLFIVVVLAAAPADASVGGEQKTDGPIIFSPEGSEVILESGQNYTIFCKGKRKIHIKQQEMVEDNTDGYFKVVNESFVSNDLDRTYKYVEALHLYNVDQFAVGYYACFDDTINSSEYLAEINREPNNTDHISYVYVYVNGLSNFFAPMREYTIARNGSDVVIGCRPTSPNITVILKMDVQTDSEDERYSPKVGFVISSYDMFLHSTKLHSFTCSFRTPNSMQEKDVYVLKNYATPPPLPRVNGGSVYFLKGETLTINCTVQYQTNSAVGLSWIFPRANKSSVLIETNEHYAIDGILYKNIIIENATQEDAGNYTCVSKNSITELSASFVKTYLETGFIVLTKESRNTIGAALETDKKVFKMQFSIRDYPPATISALRNGRELSFNNNSKLTIERKYNSGTIYFKIKNLNIYDTGNYTLVAQNDYAKEFATYDFRVKDKPLVDFVISPKQRFLQYTSVSLKCDVTGYPLPRVKWIFSPITGDSSQPITLEGKEEIKSLYEVSSILQIRQVNLSGNVTCVASNQEESAVTQPFLVYEIQDGFGIKDLKDIWFPEYESVMLTCVASKYEFVNASWSAENDLDDFVEYSDNSLSYVAKLKFNSISVSQSGTYNCVGINNNGSFKSKPVTLTVEARRPPEVITPDYDEDIDAIPYQPIKLTCSVDAVPLPQVEWNRNGEPLLNETNISITTVVYNHTTVVSMVDIKQMDDDSKGKYECSATNGDGQSSNRFYNVIMKEKSPFKAVYLGVIGGIFLVLLLVVIYLIWKIKKEKQFRKELAAAGLLNFNEGVTGSINPDLGIDEQAELLPYNKEFEFPPEKLKLGKQLGAGAFGVVYKAEARGIINAEETTTVAVKMVKKTADNMYIKALASELKIMVHLGKHVNIVNLLGACTKNVGKRELIMIVEYCKFGNIHNYLQKHREVYIDQLNDHAEKGAGRVNRAFSSSSGASGCQSDYGGSNNTQNTDNTFINTANTSRSCRKDTQKMQVDSMKVSESGYLQPEWRSNYESDYSYDSRSPRPLCSRDLLSWAFQIARGMEYLASRKVLHGDLAARNILLADDNIVKICDFGLAKNIYKNDEYKKKDNCPLPIKWLAIECMTDSIFSTQSDVWSFGIVLWEIFSLAKNPYPNISPQNLIQWLREGNRLSKPTYANEDLHKIMKQCWLPDPTERPTFGQLQEILGNYLEDKVRNHYIDLNLSYMEKNDAMRAGGLEDYLAMVSAPDYNNMVTPNPHHYVNDPNINIFLSRPALQLQHDDEGYLQMSPASNPQIFSPRVPGAKFDFNVRSLSPRADSHSELMPMLTLNNLPARSGSESDQEGNTSPYLNMQLCPRIEEEADEVFETKQNNAKNVAQNTAVTNPTYITFDIDLETKPQDIKNNYINVSVPNGLVK